MENTIKKIDQLEIPPWPKKSSLDERPFNIMPPSTLPLAPSSFQVWKRPYSINYGGAGGASSSDAGSHTSALQPSDAGSTNLSTVGDDDDDDDDNIKETQNHSPPSDKNPSSNDGVTSGVADADNSVKTETVNGVQTRFGGDLDPNIDPRKLRRIISNRVSAQKSRMKKLQYVTDLERRAKALEAQIAVLTPQVSLYKKYQQRLQMEQKSLNQQMAAFANNKIITEAEIEHNKAEVNRLRQLQLVQQQQKMQNQARMPAGWVNELTEQMPNQNLIQSGPPGPMVYMNSNQAQIGENTGEMNNLNQLNMKQQQEQQNPGQVLMPGWEPGLPNPSMNQPIPQQEVNMNSNLGGIEQILNYNP